MNNVFGIVISAIGMVGSIAAYIYAESGELSVAWLCSGIWAFNSLTANIELHSLKKKLKEFYDEVINNYDEEEVV